LDTGDFDGAIETFERLGRTVADNPGVWWNLGMAYKLKRSWADSQRCIRRYIVLQPQSREGYFNLGVAATALRDWRDARFAWRSLGLDIDDKDGPPEMELGLAPVRLNATPEGGGEVVWGRRLDPCRARLASVPTPDSGHRFGDIVLHDVVPRGQREANGYSYSVFDEIARIEPSDLPTQTASVIAPTESDVDALVELCQENHLGAEDWTSSIQFVCASCSLASTHRHERPDGPPEWEPNRHIALAGPTQHLTTVLDEWARSSTSRSAKNLEMIG
jgi:tetratricopeptide (TPR) repeat protein